MIRISVIKFHLRILFVNFSVQSSLFTSNVGLDFCLCLFVLKGGCDFLSLSVSFCFCLCPHRWLWWGESLAPQIGLLASPSTSSTKAQVNNSWEAISSLLNLVLGRGNVYQMNSPRVWGLSENELTIPGYDISILWIIYLYSWMYYLHVCGYVLGT